MRVAETMAEIGSEFWSVPVAEAGNGLIPDSAQWYISGRSALQAVIEALHGVHSVAVPAWCCDTMVKPFVDAGLEVRFYPVYWRNGLVQEPRLDCGALFLMDYFGYSGQCPEIGNYPGAVIRDVTHSILSSTYSNADYSFGSLRKWCGVWTGGYAWTGDGRRLKAGNEEGRAYATLRQQAMLQKDEYIRGVRSDKGYLSMFAEAEAQLEDAGIVAAADRDVRAARRLDVGYIKDRRRKNAAVLREAFPDRLIFPRMKETDCPLFVPVLVPDGRRDALRRYLIRHEIYCPVHWPVSEYHRLDGETEKLYQNELSLVCDQRYTEADMRRMVDTIRMFEKEG